MLHAEVTQSIIGAAMTVLNELKPGLDEKIYERALVIELELQGHTVEQQRAFPVITAVNSLARLCLTLSWTAALLPTLK